VTVLAIHSRHRQVLVATLRAEELELDEAIHPEAADWHDPLAAVVAVAYLRRGVTRMTGALIIAGYSLFVLTLLR
jgi:hypothetical protein